MKSVHCLGMKLSCVCVPRMNPLPKIPPEPMAMVDWMMWKPLPSGSFAAPTTTPVRNVTPSAARVTTVPAPPPSITGQYTPVSVSRGTVTTTGPGYTPPCTSTVSPGWAAASAVMLRPLAVRKRSTAGHTGVPGASTSLISFDSATPAALTTIGAISGINASTAIPASVQDQATVELASGIPFVSDSQLEEALADDGLSAQASDDIVEANREARVQGLDAALGVLAVIAVISLFFTRRIPAVPVGDEAAAGAPPDPS